MFQAETRDIVVKVVPHFEEGESHPEQGQWFFSYTVEIANEGPAPVQLLSRYWRITDGLGRIREVQGRGVVGEQPIIGPGDSFTYTSGCPLPTSNGIMQGTYRMMAEDGRMFDVDIPAFSLDAPDLKRTLN